MNTTLVGITLFFISMGSNVLGEDKYIENGYSTYPDYMGHLTYQTNDKCNFNMLKIPKLISRDDKICRISYPQGDQKYLIALNKCPQNMSCNWLTDLDVPIKYCDTENLGIPGDLCNIDNNCKSYVCKQGRCVGKLLNEICSGHSECEIGLSCYNGYCTTQSNTKFCYSDYNCKNGYGCSEGKCIKYASIDLFSPAPRAIFCKNLKSYNGKCYNYYYYSNYICKSDKDCSFYYEDENGDFQTGYSRCICSYSFFDYSIGKISTCEADSNFNGVKFIDKVIDLNLHTYNRFSVKFLKPKEIYEIKYPLYKQYDNGLINLIEDLNDDLSSYHQIILQLIVFIVIITA